MDGDGQITKEEFVEKGLQSNFINELLLATRVDQQELENYDGTAVPVSYWVIRVLLLHLPDLYWL